MRTTVTIADDLYTEAKIRAAATAGSVGSVIEEALRAYLRQPQASSHDEHPLPTGSLGSLAPGLDLNDMSSVYEALDEGRPLDARR